MRNQLLALALALCVVLALGAAAHAAKPPAKSGGTTFTNYSIAGTPSDAPPGTVCPGSDSCGNFAAEPQVRATLDGQFYASSENGLGGGTDAWRSTDGGLHYASLVCPNCASSTNNTGFAPGGGDTDIAVATAKNAVGNYNVYVASLSGADVDVSTSSDNGGTWSLNPASALPIDDREWIAATGASQVCISYLTAAGFLLPEVGLHVSCSSDAGTTWLQQADAYDQSDVGEGCRLGSRAGNLAFDPAHPNYLYALAACGTVADATNPNPTGLHVLVMAVSSDGGRTFTDHVVYTNPNTDASYQNQFPQVSLDSAGNVYAVYSDDSNVFYSFSTNHGQTWSGPFQISKSGTNLMPWSVGGDAGKLDVVYYHTDTVGNPETVPDSATWSVSFAQNLQATTAGSSFSLSTASPAVIHHGAVCQGGALCTGNRDLLDDFGVAANPLTGLASIVYSDDQYRNDALNKPSVICTPTDNNTVNCDHTAIATQTSGTGIYSVKHR